MVDQSMVGAASGMAASYLSNAYRQYIPQKASLISESVPVSIPSSSWEAITSPSSSSSSSSGANVDDIDEDDELLESLCDELLNDSPPSSPLKEEVILFYLF